MESEWGIGWEANDGWGDNNGHQIRLMGMSIMREVWCWCGSWSKREHHPLHVMLRWHGAPWSRPCSYDAENSFFFLFFSSNFRFIQIKHCTQSFDTTISLSNFIKKTIKNGFIFIVIIVLVILSWRCSFHNSRVRSNSAFGKWSRKFASMEKRICSN